jgi:site-specific recombinase XerD
MKEQVIREIQQRMQGCLNNAQMRQLQEVLSISLGDKQVTQLTEFTSSIEATNDELMGRFLSAKRVEGCSEKTLKYYRVTLQRFLASTIQHLTQVTTDDLRTYLGQYQQLNQCGKTNMDNIRRILSSFFGWLEDEDYILKSPVRRIRKVKSAQTVKETYSDEALEQLRDACTSLRDLAMLDMFASTGMRVGELVRLNIEDVDFENREVVVLGKGDKERPVYFDARTKIHLRNYLASRTDSNPALFVSLHKPYKRLQVSGVEIRLRGLGAYLGLTKVHPHKFRRTLATRAIDKGMPIEQVQCLLGHAKIDTTMQYAQVNQNNVKTSHRRYIG